MVSDYDALQAIFDSVANGTFNEEPFERPCVKPWQPPTRPWTEIDLEAMADSTNHTLDFTVVVPPPVKVRSNASPKPSKKQSAPTTSKAPLPKQSASIPRPSIASSSTSVAKPTSTKAQKRPRPIINSSGESSAEEVVVIQKARAGEVSNGRKVDKGKGKEKEEQPKVSKKGKEREVEPSSRNERPSEDKQRRSEKDGEKQKKKSKKPRRESRSEDEDDLELSGKETVVEERFRAGKKASKGLTAYKEAVAGKSMHSFLLFLHADLFSLPERKRKEESAKAKSKQRVLDSDDEVIVKRASPAKHKRVLPKFSGGTSDPDKDSDDSEHSEESSDTSSSDEGPDERGNLKGMMVDADEDEEDEETKDLRRSTLQKHTDKTQELDFFAKTYVQWIVLQCAAPRIDWLGLPNSDFQLAFDKIEGRLNDVLDSVRSPIWRRDFRRFLDFYPEFGNVEFKVYGGHVEGQKQPGCGAFIFQGYLIGLPTHAHNSQTAVAKPQSTRSQIWDALVANLTIGSPSKFATTRFLLAPLKNPPQKRK
ncbi:hypothetical protein P7C70_g3318, partial [Phenoliferia sp. Uapishka_3]